MASRASETPARKPKYRTGVPLPPELNTHLKIYFEERLFHNALTLFGDVVCSGASHPDHLELPTFIPTPQHIEIVSSFLVHPRFTTQASKKAPADLPSRAITLLRSLLSIVGPLNAGLGKAFSLKAPEGRNARGKRYDSDDGDSSEDENIDVRGILGTQGRIQRCAKDFWHIVGWAFNCSVVDAQRWRYWKVWLDYILDVLDADWEERRKLDADDPGGNDGHIKGSLIVEYLSEVRGRSTAVKRVVASAFTDGGELDKKAFPEVYPNETLGKKPGTGTRRKRIEDFRNGFEDFEDSEDDDEEFDFAAPADEEMPSSQASQLSEDGDLQPDPWLGGSESIVLRQRILTQLSLVAFYLPSCFVGIRELYQTLADNIKQLPLPAFSLIVSAADSSVLPVEVYVSLIQVLIIRYLPSNAPPPRTVSTAATGHDEMDQTILEKCYLPFAASTSSVEDNAKISILLENALRLHLKSGAEMKYTADLKGAVEKGIAARENKIKTDKRRGAASKKQDEEDKIWLKASEIRLKSLLAMVAARKS